jgi:O-antigen ligase
MPSVPQEYLKRISSGRIFGTLFYPNSLAGVLLLLTPPMVAVVLRCQRLTIAAKRFLAVALGAAVLACLCWSGSKGGWLLALLLGIVSLLRLPHAQRVRNALVMILIIAGLAGFFWKYSGFFRKGATSVSARMDYWRAAAQTAITHPLFGTGPGTFAIPYEKLKRPESEMSRMVHNDYLEQASDSGFIGFLAYIGFITAGLVWGRRALSDLPRGPASTSVAPAIQLRPEADASAPGFWVWLGLLGWALQGLFEFGLYVPALAWTAFAFLGWLLGSSAHPQTSQKKESAQEVTASSTKAIRR